MKSSKVFSKSISLLLAIVMVLAIAPMAFAAIGDSDSNTANDVNTLGLVGVSATSSDTNVATAAIENGYIKITSVGAGNATIIVKDGTKEATIPVTVATDGSISLGTITKYIAFNGTDNNSTANDVNTLGLVGASATSSDINVATAAIENGYIKITSVGAGNATIIVKDGTKEATIPVTVATDGSISLGTITKYIAFNSTDNNSTANDVNTLGLIGKIATSSDTNVANAVIENGKIKITSVGAGNATIIVKDGTKEATIPVTVATDGSISLGTITKYIAFNSTINNSTANDVNTLGLIGKIATSSNKKVATAVIENGKIKITSVGAGNATISIKDGSKEATIPVTVANDGSISLGTITKYIAFSVSGKVIESAKPLSGVDVALKDAKGKVLQTVRTNTKGEYTFSNVVGGDYTIVASKRDYVTQTISLSSLNQNVTKDITMVASKISVEKTTMSSSGGNNVVTIKGTGSNIKVKAVGGGKTIYGTVTGAASSQKFTLKFPKNTSTTSNVEYVVSYSIDGGTNYNTVDTVIVTVNKAYKSNSGYEHTDSGNSSSSSKPATTTTPPKTSSNVSADGSVSATAIISETNTAINAAKTAGATVASIRTQNATSIASSTLQSIAKAATDAAKTVVLYADTMTSDGKAVAVRMYIYPANFGAATANVNLSASVQSSRTDSIKKTFEKWFSNKVVVVSLGQQGKFPSKVEIAAKVDLTGLNAQQLTFYAYDSASNSYKLLTETAHFVDTSGYLHFSTESAGDIIITDKLLTAK